MQPGTDPVWSDKPPHTRTKGAGEEGGMRQLSLSPRVMAKTMYGKHILNNDNVMFERISLLGWTLKAP